MRIRNATAEKLLRRTGGAHRRVGPWRTATALLAFTLLAGGVVTDLALPPLARADVITAGKDVMRTGWYPDQPSLSPALVGGGTFGQQFSTPVDGQIYAQPLVANGTLLVATETNNAYGLDPGTGTQRWTTNLGTSWNPADLRCGDLTPSVGVTSTPVVDATTNTIYLVSKTYVSGSSGPAAWYTHALDITTGVERPNFPVLISGAAANDPRQTFDATHQMQRPGLLLLGGVVYAGFGGHCDSGAYTGWVVGISTTGTLRTLWSDESQTGAGAGIWQSGSGLVSDGPGQIVLATGNGKVADVPTPGHTPPNTFGEAVVRLTVQADGTLKPTDYFAPYDAASLNVWDADLGSGGPVALPAQFGTSAYPRLLVEVGKEGYVYLMDRDNFGGMGQGPSGGDAVLQRIGQDGGVWGKPTPWPGDGGYVYITTASAGTTMYGNGGVLHAYKYGLDGVGKPTLSLMGTSADSFGLSSSPPVVTSDGTNSGTALIWVIFAPSGSGIGGQLRAYSPVPVNGVLQLVKSWPIGLSAKFNAPAVNNNHVYVGTRDGHVLGFGAPVATPMSASAVSWPATTQGQSQVATATLTANAALTVTGVSTTNNDFTAGTPSSALPATLAAGDTLTVPVTFAPSTKGQISGALTVLTSLGSVGVALNGLGQSAYAELSANPKAVSFGGVAVGRIGTGSATFSNIGAQSLTVSSFDAPAAPFGVTGMPAPGYVMQPGSSFTATTSFSPSALGTFTDRLVLHSSAGTVAVPMSGSAAPPPQMVISPPQIQFGSIPTGATATATFTVSNTGGTPLTITKSKPPVAGTGFTATSALPEGSSLAAGASLTETVQFAPTSTGTAGDNWILTGNDSSGVQTVNFTGNGGTAAPVPSPVAGNWTLNGSAILINGGLQLTDSTTPGQAGSAFWPTPVSSSYLNVSFDTNIDSGGGADGMTLALADATAGATATSLGVNGGGLGWARIPGIALALDTYANGTDPSSNFMGVATGFSTTNNDNLVWQATTVGLAPLRNVTRHIKVVVTGGQLTASMDGVQVLSTPVTLSAQTLIGFTGGDGAILDRHAISNVVITTSTPVAVAPSAPTAVTATAGNATAAVSWSTPASNGGAAITSYTVTATPGGATATVTGTPTATSAVVTGLSNGTAYTFAITATNSVGVGPASTASPSVTPIAPAPVPTLSVADTGLAMPAVGTTGQTLFTVTLSAASGQPVTVNYQTSDGTAKAGIDYVALPATALTFAAGQTTQSIPVTVMGNGLHGLGMLDLHLVLFGATGATLADGDGRARVVKTLGPLSVYIANTTVRPSATVGTTAQFKLTLSAPPAAGEWVSVMVSTSDGSATTAAGDYTGLPLTSVRFAPGTSTVTVNVPIGIVAGPKPNKVFTLNLTTASTNAVIGTNKASATIVNGAAAPAPNLSVSDAVLAMPAVGTTGQAMFTVTLSAASGKPVTVNYQTSDGAAKAGIDYVALPATALTFAAGQTTQSIPVTVMGNGLHGLGMLDLHLVLSGATGASVADGDGRARVVKTLGPLSVYVANTTVQQSATVGTTAQFQLTLSAPTAAGEWVSVMASTSDGSATTAAGDYTGLPLTSVRFAPGTSTVTVNVPIGIAAGPKPNKLFTLNLTRASNNAVISISQASATIVNGG